uniref:Cullin family profile domain-containing protein n=1 Tax=Acrobeloides nanus TaxID=290746 RepID=A0A914E5Y8_9BILA
MSMKVILNPFVLKSGELKKNRGLRVLLKPVKETKKADVEFMVNHVIRDVLRSSFRAQFHQHLILLRQLERYQCSVEFVRMIKCLGKTIEQLEKVIASEYGDSFSVWPHLFNEVFQYSINLFKEILIRVLKHHFSIFRDLEDDYCSNPAIKKEKWFMDKEKKIVNFMNCLKETLNLLCYEYTYNIHDLMKESVCLALKQIVNFEMEQLCMDLTDENILPKTNTCMEMVENWAESFDVQFTDLHSSLSIYCKKAFINQMILHVFDLVIVHFPKTKITVGKLRVIMQQLDWYGRDRFLAQLVKDINNRLLHVGVNTHDILKGYAKTVECLTLFDPSFVLVHKVCRVIRDYVTARPDTMRSIITFITSERPGELKNLNRASMILDEEQLASVNDEYVLMAEDNLENRWFSWRPDPIDANPCESKLFRQSADVFNMLVSIYGSKDLFVKEYRQLLAERLINDAWEKNLHSEFVYLEMMKKRFTEGELNQCEVMLRDMKDSQRIYEVASTSSPTPISTRIISAEFWPEIVAESFKIPEVFAELLSSYKKHFEEQKASRTLIWYTGYGVMVDLDIELSGVQISLEVPLGHAAVLLLFLEKDTWNLDEIAKETEMAHRQTKRRVDWWCNKGVLKSANFAGALCDTWTLNSDTAALELFARHISEQKDRDDLIEEEVEEVGGDLEPKNPAVDQLEQYWAYTRNLLKINLAQQPNAPTAQPPVTADRLLSIFKLLVSPGMPAPSLESVVAFMQRKIKLNMVVLENGVYKPTKNIF